MGLESKAPPWDTPSRGPNKASLSHSPEPGDEGEPGRSGLELEPEEPPGWRELVPLGTLHSLPKSQVKRQEVISGECPTPHPAAAKDATQLWLRQTDAGKCPSQCYRARQSMKAACSQQRAVWLGNFRTGRGTGTQLWR